MDERVEHHHLVRQLAELIERTCRVHFELEPLTIPVEFHRIDGSVNGQRLKIGNQAWESPQFRKIHIQLARIGSALDVLHCTMFPRVDHDLPIFGAELVAVGAKVNAAIVDLSPTSPDRRLPADLEEALARLPKVRFSHPRELPEWGDIFSEHCLFLRLEGLVEEERFLSRAGDYLHLHCERAARAEPVAPERRTALAAMQRQYCIKQQSNEKTRQILERAFGTGWTERYVSTVLFDMPDQ